MRMLMDKINASECVYSAYTKWGLKQYICEVAYFTEEPLDDLYYVICSILDASVGKCYNKWSLGALLGFSVSDIVHEGKQVVYYDVAEVRAFEDMLNLVEQEHLIQVVDTEVFLTELGRISLREGKHYQFFEGVQYLYEHASVKSENQMALLLFPFCSDMGICSSVRDSKQIWPLDRNVEDIIYYEMSPLIQRLAVQSKEVRNVYSAQLQPYFDLETKKVPVRLYQSGDAYIPVVMQADQVAERATELLLEGLNNLIKENIILECLFQKLWDDRSSVLNYEALEPYLDLVDYEELAKDMRTQWADKRLFGVIVERASTTCWRNITRYCDLQVLKAHIHELVQSLDWPLLTERIDDDFLVKRFLDYPWDLEVLSEDTGRKESVIEQLILLQKDTTEDWNWDALGHRLSSDFVLSHLDLVKVNLSAYTEDTTAVRQVILSHPDKRWDWDKIESSFDLAFIYDHIAVLGAHLGLVKLFDRVFIDAEWSPKFTQNGAFARVLSESCRMGGVISTAVFNDKAYQWSTELIDLLIRNGLLFWESTPYMTGFESNPHLIWTKEFFDIYSSNVVTVAGRRVVSAQIADISILTGAPHFQWDWDSISSNELLLTNRSLFTRFGTNLNWKLVFAHQTDAAFLQSIDHIESMIGDDKEAWTAFSAIASIDYVVSKFKSAQFPWDWTVLTERMFQKLKLENLDNPLFVDQWNWTYLSGHVSEAFLMDNLERFSKYWDWAVCLPRILNAQNRFDFDYLDRLALILTNIPGKSKCDAAWAAMTKQYSFDELKRIIKDTSRKRAYWWDMDYFCRHERFYVFRDLEDCWNILDWKIISSSESVDKSLKYNPKMGIKPKAWFEKVQTVLSDSRFHWNFTLLSHFESLRDQRWFLSKYKDKVDWNYLSETGKVFCVRDKQQLNEVIQTFKEYINFRLISGRDDVDIEQIIKINPRGDYDYNRLVEKGVVKVTLQLVEELEKYPWDWQLVTSATTSFVPTVSFLFSHLDCNLNWRALSLQENKRVWSNPKVVLAVAQKESISKQLDWRAISSTPDFPLTKEVLAVIPLDKVNWTHLSCRKEISAFIADYADYIDWTVLADNVHVDYLNLEFLRNYRDYVDWVAICRKREFLITNAVLDEFADYLDWSVASGSTHILFSKTLVDKYKDKWYWPILVKNKAFNNVIDIAVLPYVKQLNVIDFISRFSPNKPKAYHFTHMANAVNILRSMKLKSRNYARGNFSNSAGSNVFRTGKAHRFARFYFLPKSPTQFYNECLGKDLEDSRYYERAYNLGLPKCPLPVFFVFDIEELLSVMPDKCYYSNGNMQKDSSMCFKVVEDPSWIRAKEIYVDGTNNFEERQQEFLIDGELDFSTLRNVQIYCYDDYQAEMLKKELEGTKWVDAISWDYSLYEHCNKEIDFFEDDASISIRTNYRCPFELRVSYIGSKAPTILNTSDVLRHRGNDIYVASLVEIKKDVPFKVYFEVNSPIMGSWLIYKNEMYAVGTSLC